VFARRLNLVADVAPISRMASAETPAVGTTATSHSLKPQRMDETILSPDSGSRREVYCDFEGDTAARCEGDVPHRYSPEDK
jgi:hypothetical protein